jgi:hypothetical protein
MLHPEERAMTDAVRFYWQRGEAELPLAAIAEEDRSPLRVRRSLVQAFAPTATAQLAAGRFIAVVWPIDGKLRMLVCHPNAAKGSDSLLVNPSALPQLTIKLSGWEEAPAVASLFLRAFGSEAATPDECATARQDLAAWLTNHSQPEMAAVTRHYSAFPFGVRSEALDVIHIWRKLLVQGEKEQIDRLLEEWQHRFEAIAWTRDFERETKMNGFTVHRLNRFYCWQGGRGVKPEVMLCLNRTTPKRVRGSTFDILDPLLGLVDLAHTIQHVLRDVVEAAAIATGLSVSYARLGPISRVGENTARAMTAFAEEADRQLSPTERTEKVKSLWQTFIHTAFREDVAINPDELTSWFNASGWNMEASSELSRRFYSEMALLAEFEEAGSEPA